MFVIGGMIGLLAVGGLLFWARMAPAQPPVPSPPGSISGQSQIKSLVQDVDVRAGPSDQYYVTNRLTRGSTVEVVALPTSANPGWLAIKPPQGSRSWINNKYLRQPANGPTGYVDATPFNADGAPVQPVGLDLTQEKELSFVKLSNGAQPVLFPGTPKSDHDGKNTWLAIEPPAAEVRYIPATAVSQNMVQRTSADETGFAPSAGVSYVAQGDEFLKKAREAYATGVRSSDQAQSSAARSRLAALDGAMPQVAFQSPGFPANNAFPANNNPAPPRVNLNMPSGQLTGANTALYTTAGQPAGPAQWTRWGNLKKTALGRVDQPMYRLEDDRGTPLGYAVAGPGLTLEPYVGQLVCLYGATAYRSDDVAMRGNYTIVTQLALPNR
jgi:hypothetical protein